MKLYGQTIRDLRNKAGMSREVLAQKSGVAASTIKWWEDGRIMPTVGNFEKVLIALGATFVLGEENDNRKE